MPNRKYMAAKRMKEMEVRRIVLFRYLFLIAQKRKRENKVNSDIVNKLKVMKVRVGYLFDL